MSVDCRDVGQATGSVTDKKTKFKERKNKIKSGFICIGEVGGGYVLCGLEPSLRVVLGCGGGRYPFANRENMSSGPLFAVMTREQVLRFKTV